MRGTPDRRAARDQARQQSRAARAEEQPVDIAALRARPRALGGDVEVLDVQAQDLVGVVFSPDGRTLASASADDTVRLWDATTRKPLGRLTGHTGAVAAVAFSPDGKTLASASYDKTVRLWDPATRKPLGRLTGHTDVVYGVAFSPDGKTLASASIDKTVRVWDEVLWRSVAELRATVCDVLLTGLTRSDWERYAPGTSYRRSCP